MDVADNAGRLWNALITRTTCLGLLFEEHAGHWEASPGLQCNVESITPGTLLSDDRTDLARLSEQHSRAQDLALVAWGSCRHVPLARGAQSPGEPQVTRQQSQRLRLWLGRASTKPCPFTCRMGAGTILLEGSLR
jgi:hypothetical protein